MVKSALDPRIISTASEREPPVFVQRYAFLLSFELLQCLVQKTLVGNEDKVAKFSLLSG